MYRRRSVQPSRRAVLQVQAPGDPGVAAGLVRWFTERAFHFYVAGLHMPAAALRGRRPDRHLAAALADLDAACAHLRQSEGMTNVLVSGHGLGATAAAMWSDARQSGAADALILHDPALPRRLTLNITCPVLVLVDATGEAGEDQTASDGSRRWPLARRGDSAASTRLGRHVTWLALEPGSRLGDDGTDPRHVFDQLGRWLGAYMYGQARDQLL